MLIFHRGSQCLVQLLNTKPNIVYFEWNSGRTDSIVSCRFKLIFHFISYRPRFIKRFIDNQITKRHNSISTCFQSWINQQITKVLIPFLAMKLFSNILSSSEKTKLHNSNKIWFENFLPWCLEWDFNLELLQNRILSNVYVFNLVLSFNKHFAWLCSFQVFSIFEKFRNVLLPPLDVVVICGGMFQRFRRFLPRRRTRSHGWGGRGHLVLQSVVHRPTRTWAWVYPAGFWNKNNKKNIKQKSLFVWYFLHRESFGSVRIFFKYQFEC